MIKCTKENMRYKIKRTMGYDVFSDNLDKIDLDNKYIINTISPNSYGIATKDKEFKRALIKSDFLVLDGVYFALGYFLKTGKKIVKNQGPFLVDFFLNKANKEKLKVFFMGSSIETLNKIQQKLSINFPFIVFESYSPPYKKSFNELDNNEIISNINKFNPDILFVGMTCPKQEKWSYLMKDKLNVKLICNVGAVFDWIAGNQKEINPLWWKLRLAWLKRTIDRPEILKRYPNISIYFKDMLMSLLRINKIKLN